MPVPGSLAQVDRLVSRGAEVPQPSLVTSMSVIDNRPPARRRRGDRPPRRGLLERACSGLERAFGRVAPTIDSARKPVRAWHRLKKDWRGDDPRPKRGTFVQRITGPYTAALLGYGAFQPGADLSALHVAVAGAPGGRTLLAINVALVVLSGTGLVRKRPPGGP